MHGRGNLAAYVVQGDEDEGYDERQNADQHVGDEPCDAILGPGGGVGDTEDVDENIRDVSKYLHIF